MHDVMLCSKSPGKMSSCNQNYSLLTVTHDQMSVLMKRKLSCNYSRYNCCEVLRDKDRWDLIRVGLKENIEEGGMAPKAELVMGMPLQY